MERSSLPGKADAIRGFAMLMLGDVKVFPVSEREAALAWAAD
jgi:hypothetical protein